MSIFLALVLTASTWSQEIFIEAEDANLEGVTVATSRTGYSGTGYVTGFDEPGDSLRFSFELTAGVYEVVLGAAQDGRFAQYALNIDGVERAGTLVGSGGSFREVVFLEYRFSEGPHTLAFNGTMDVDYLRLTPVSYEGPTAPALQLVDPDASTATQALMDFLLDQYGRTILAGQQSLDEVQYVHQITGREPAIGSFDLIDYSPSRVACGLNPRGAEQWMNWAETDGIVNLMWHWNAPTDLIDDNCNISDNAPGQEWWSGFYTRATTFNFAEALADPNSERYQLLLRDMDAIAIQLQKFEDANIPVLWRPLHEAAGGWFWWGAQGADPFVALWRLLYDRLVNVHGIHNLIWVYTHEPNANEWYPGDAYVDITTRDVYANDPSAIMKSDWDVLQELYGDRKLVALSESGTLPDPSVITDFGIWWSWFSIWNNEFIRDIDPNYLHYVYNHELVTTRDELPDWRNTPSDRERVPLPSHVAMDVFPNPTRGHTTLRVQLPKPAQVEVEIFDVLGRRVRAYVLGFRSAGELNTRIEAGSASGLYIVRLKAGDFSAHQTLVVTH